MKNYIVARYPEEDCTYDQLRQAIKKAWDSITAEQLSKLIESMRQRCQDVIDAEGGIQIGRMRIQNWAVQTPVQAIPERFFRLIL